jgi:hypothetical protein
MLTTGKSHPAVLALVGCSVVALVCSACGSSTTGRTENVSDRPAAFTSSEPVGSAPKAGEPTTDFYGYRGSEQIVTGPTNATSVEITVVSGKGGDSKGSGGKSESVTATWPLNGQSTITMDIGGAGTKGAAGWSGAGAGGGTAGCSNAGGGGGATVVKLNDNVIAVSPGGGGAGYHGASVLSDFGGNGGGPESASGNGSGPAAGKAGVAGNGGSLQAGGNGSNGKNLGGCAGGGGGGMGGGGGGTGGGTGGGGGGGGGIGGAYISGASDHAVYSSSIGFGNLSSGFVELTWLPQ